MHVSAQSVTLYAVSQDVASEANQVSIAASNSVSAAGTDSHGGTTYVDVEVVTSEVLIKPDTTITVLSVPTTTTFTWVEDASGIQESFLRSGETAGETCGFGTDGHGTCVETRARPPTTETFTFSGNVVPLFTVAAAPSPSKQNAALRTAYMGWNVLSAAVVMALFQAS
ncbi:hypothetical protein B0H14DRAFT_2635544 [Mycena olivaceomarginata]|nr:hypothetical protein B0H14DRAFT_2635544 [Mycena olivaceomarginata]